MKRIKKYIMLVIGIVFTSAMVNAQTVPWVAPSSADALKNPFANNEDATKKGKKLYNQFCSICHGDKGKGDGIAGVALTPKPGNFTTDKVQSQTDGAIFWKIRTGNPPMAPYKDIIKDDEIWALINYIRTFSKKPTS